MMLNCNLQTLGALTMPANCDAQLVTTQRMLPDGSIGVFVGDYQLTGADLQALESWRQNCIAERQRAYDMEAARRAVELAQQPIVASPFSIGPGTRTDPAPNVTLAVDYVNAISNPALRSQAQQAVTLAVQQNPTLPTSGLVNNPGSSGSVTQPGGSTYAPGSGTPVDAGFPDAPTGAAPASGSGGLVLAALLALSMLG